MVQDKRQVDSHKKRIHIYLLLACTLFVILSLGSGISKYKHQEIKDDGVLSKSFYFTSDYLTEKGKEYTLSSDTTNLIIELRNYADDLRSTTDTISYEYTINGGKSLEGTIPGGDKKTSNITLNNLSAGTYKVIAKAKSPYSKTLVGTFIIPKEDETLSYEVNDNSGSPYALLTISTKYYDGNINISWPSGIVPDSTQDVFKNCSTWTSGNYDVGNINTKVSAYSSYTYQFFKTDTSQVYDENKIKVEKVQ